MDLRGHGKSEVPAADSPLTMQRLVADVLELVDHLDCASVHLAGASAGGFVAQHLAMDAAPRVRSLALFASTPGLKHTQVTTWLPRIAKDGLRRFLEQTIWERFPQGTADPGLVRWFIDETARNDVAFIARFVGLMSTLDWSEELHRILCPTLLVIPGAETVGGVGIYRAMQERIRDLRVLLYEGQPHNLSDAVPDRVAEDLLAFLRERFGVC
jgi:pimeloyl-ACP methyl ester carboxylesterase